MVMPRYLIGDEAVAGDRVRIDGDLGRHLSRSLRVAPGERLLVITASGIEHGVVVDRVDGDLLEATSLFARTAAGEPRLRVHVVQALVRELDDVVAGATHAGAASIRPFLAERSVVRPRTDQMAARRDRWHAIAREAAQLCGRVTVPRVEAAVGLDAVLRNLPAATRILTCDMHAPVALSRTALDDGDVAVVIGPEGSLSEAEMSALDAAGATRVHLGPRTFPARSAAALAVTVALCAAGDLDEPAAPPPWPA